jgi:hypothetical protein
MRIEEKQAYSAEFHPPDYARKYRYARMLRAPSGAVYFYGGLKSTDGGRTLTPQSEISVEKFVPRPESATLWKPGFFLSLQGHTELAAPGEYACKAWRSRDDLRTVEEFETRVFVPQGPTRKRREHEWSGLYFFRVILEMPPGYLLAPMEGNFDEDMTVLPTDYQSKAEAAFKQRTIIVRSDDEGRTWRYVSTVAFPKPEYPVGEGFCEPALALLDDGRLLCVMRTGHYYPLYACWSSDEGRTWTPPLYTGLERGCDPWLIKLADGRLAMSYGKRYPEGWSQIVPGGDMGRPDFVYPGAGWVKLAISEAGAGASWHEAVIGRNCGACYSTLFEVKPNVLLCQASGWQWRVEIEPT